MMAAALTAVALVVGVLLGHLTRAQPSTAPTLQTDASEPAPTEERVVRVHVSGMVMSPGVVDVPSDAIVADAIDAAGGLRAEALVDQINLAAPVAEGDQIVVPGPGSEASDPEPSGDGIIALNRASVAELETLPGVGPVLAERIVAFRDQNGGFDTVEGLLEVPGIGEAKLASIRDLVRP